MKKNILKDYIVKCCVNCKFDSPEGEKTACKHCYISCGSKYAMNWCWNGKTYFIPEHIIELVEKTHAERFSDILPVLDE